MEFLTAKETARQWNISSRMVAYYCKAGKIAGAVKKGKTWLIPARAIHNAILVCAIIFSASYSLLDV